MPTTTKRKQPNEERPSSPLNEEFHELLMRLKSPVLLLRLKRDFLTPKESKLVGEVTIGRPEHGEKWATAVDMVRTVAKQRGLSLKRALLEIARSIDSVGPGNYERLRKAIGEPVVPAPPTPQWDAIRGELSFKSNVVRRVSKKARNCRLILDSFQEEGWPHAMDSPFAVKRGSRTLSEALRTLNEGLCGLKFFADGAGGMSWRATQK